MIPATACHTDAVADLRTSVAVLAWIPATLLADVGGDLARQRVLGFVAWALLAWLLVGESALVRAQTVVVVAFATAVEYTCSPWLGFYTYRLDNVPAFVPPGHGLVYLGALCLGRSSLVRSHARGLVTATVVAAGLYAAWGMTPLAPRPDVLGLLWFGCLVGFLAVGRSRLLYVGAFWVVTVLELLGTWLGTWTWAAQDPTGWVSMGNPPAVAAGGYGWFDLAAVLGAPVLLSWVARLRRGWRAGQPAGVVSSASTSS